MSNIVQEGFRQRTSAGCIRWICHACQHVMTVLADGNACANCKAVGKLSEIKTPERLHDETEAARESQRFHYWQSEDFNPQSWESQLGQALTPQQVLKIIQRWIPGAKMIPQINPILGKTLNAFYVPYEPTPQEQAIMMPTEVRGKLKFICCGELKIMPEWDILPLDDDKKSLPPIRGWRSVLGIFYRAGLIPFVPDDGRRLAWWQIRQSPLTRSNNA